MKIKRGLVRPWFLWALVLLLAVPPGGIMAQGGNPDGSMTFRQEELDQMLAPIALYPDDLLSQILMAATYPLEVVQAARWVQASSNFRGDQLAMALEQQDWDPSVKSMINFPDVLQMMNERLEWTQVLGDAFLAAQDQVLDTIQRLREKAQAQGSLRTTSQLRVIPDPLTQVIIIEPVDPQVFYVPVYDPMVVYGPWWWPAYRPFFHHPRGVVIPGRFIGFGIGVAIGLPWGYAWGGCDWHHHRVVINTSRNVYLNNQIDRNRYAPHVTIGSGGRGIWAHNPDHRRGIAYRSPAIARQFGRGPLPGADARRGFRGYDQPTPGGGFVPRSNRPEGKQSRVTPSPNLVRPETARPPTPPTRQPREIPGPRVARPEPPRPDPPRPSSVPVQPSRVTAGPASARPEVRRPSPGPGHQDHQGLQGPTAFGGPSPGGQTRQSSNRGHESLSGPKAGTPPSGGSKTPTGGGHPGGGRPGSGPGHERGK
jgi:hypothetical protein